MKLLFKQNVLLLVLLIILGVFTSQAISFSLNIQETNINRFLQEAEETITEESDIVSVPGDSQKKGLYASFIASFSAILVSEIGDKTFFIAAIMSMKFGYLPVFLGAIGALIAQTVLSCVFGIIIVQLVPQILVSITAMLLFFIFGGMLLKEAIKGGNDDGIQEEIEEIEKELETFGQTKQTEGEDSNYKKMNDYGEVQQEVKPQQAFGKVFFQALSWTFIAEWGDRSQITTIALAAKFNPVMICIGGILGHSICTGGAVIAGKYLQDKISTKQVNLCGGILFVIFGLSLAYELLTGESS